MKRFFKSTQFKIFLFVLAALLIGTVLAAVGQSEASPLTKVVSVAFTPLQKASGFVSEKVRLFSSSFASANALRSENEELRAQLADYQNRLVDYEDLQHKMASYEEMLGVKEAHPDFSLVPAGIIGTDAADLFSSLMIDKGTSDGVQVNDPVVCGSYLVGIVKKVNPSYSVVHTILNPAVNVSALESKTRESGYVTTDPATSAAGKCLLQGLDRTTMIAPGGLVVTSGVGGLYPKGLIVGTVSQVLESEVDLTAYCVLTPGTDISALEDVFVITEFKGQGIEQIRN